MTTFQCVNGHKSTISSVKCAACGEAVSESFSNLAGTSSIDVSKSSVKLNSLMNNRQFLLTTSIVGALAIALVALARPLFVRNQPSAEVAPIAPTSVARPPIVTPSPDMSLNAPELSVPGEPLQGPFTIARVLAADTIDVISEDGVIHRVRLVGIDAPSEDQAAGVQQCGGSDSLYTANQIFSYPNLKVMLEPDSSWPKTDEFGNEYFYIWLGEELYTVNLIASGDAIEFPKHGPYRHQDAHLKAQQNAKGNGETGVAAGLWKKCPGDNKAGYGLTADADTWTLATVPFLPGQGETVIECHPSYIGTCLDPKTGDYNCGSQPVLVVGPDVYRLDGDNDGVACEQ